MPDFQLVDERTGLAAGISSRGELFTAPISYSEPHYVSIDVAATAFEIVPGKAGKKFVITSMLLASSKTFASATTAETLTIYEASTADLDTNTKILVQLDMLKNDRMVATGLNIATSNAISIAAIATDISVDVTVSGYYVVINGD